MRAAVPGLNIQTWEPDGACLGLGRLGLAVVPVCAAVGQHLLVLLFLRVVEQSFDLRVRVLHDGLELGATILLRERCVGAQGLHLLATVRDDGRNLRNLVTVQAQTLAEMRGHPAGINVALEVTPVCLRGLRRIGVG